MRFTHYKARHIARFKHLPGVERFCHYYRIYGNRSMAPVDRSGALCFPVQTKSLFPLPKMRGRSEGYETLCNARAAELLARAERLKVPMYLLWSGGIDSTCLLISLLKNATPAQKKRLIVLMTEESISEYPWFYAEHIRGKLERGSAGLFPYILGTKNMVVTGEHNDQLFGSDIMADFDKQFGIEQLKGAYNADLFKAFFTKILDDDSVSAGFYVALFEKLCAKAPLALKTNFDRLWWVNFCLKWQTVYMRMVSFISEQNIGNLSSAYLKDYYASFYSTEEFQLWSMNNPDQRMREGWRSYKWPAKEVIYKFTKDEVYRDTKMKRGSLQHLLAQRPERNFIDEKFRFHQHVAVDQFYEPANDFV